MMQKYFILGTDTDSGKTYVLSQLLHYLRRSSKKALGIKPIASGCEARSGGWASADADLLNLENRAAELDELSIAASLDENWWRLPLPVSPHLAAQAQNQRIDLHELLFKCRRLSSLPLDYLFFEGAGGLMVPLNHEQTWVDFLIEMKIPVILVVGMRLGCINHALLTVEVLKRHSIDCAGWIANIIDPSMLKISECIDTLSDKIPYDLLTILDYSESINSFSLMAK